jgi:glycosyltransferase involved in cell wall biosynthesis
MKIIFEGWHFLPHSFGITNQFIQLEMLRRNITFFHQPVAFLDESWQETSGLLDEVSEQQLRNIPLYQGESADLTFRLSVPYDFAPAHTEKIAVFGTTEWGILHNEDFRVKGAESLRAGHANPHILIITTSHWSRLGFLRSGAVPERVIVVPCGIEPNIYQPINPDEKIALRESLGWDDGFVFLNVGSCTPNKGIELLLKSFAVVAQQYPSARLVLKGIESIYESNSLMAQYIENLTLEEAELILPRLSYISDNLSFREMVQLYQAADCYVCPYLAEGFNMPALEAIACGLPIICTQGGPTDDFTKPDFALHINSVFQSGGTAEQPIYRLMPNTDHLIELMGEVIKNQEFCQQAYLTGPAHVQANFTWQNTVDILLQVFTDFLN